MVQRVIPAPVKFLSTAILALLLAACGGGGGGSAPSDTVAPAGETLISGSVGDGPIVGAQLNIYDKDGQLLQTETSDNSANYSARIKAKGSAYPLTIVVKDGIDLVTGRGPDFTLTSVVAHPSVKQVNVNPFTTLIVESARSMAGGLSEETIAAAQAIVIDQLNFGLDPALVADPIGTPISDENIAVIVKSSEALGEMIRRSRDMLMSTGAVDSADDVVYAIADDLGDGVVDGLGVGRANGRIAAAATLASAQVMVESLSNNLKVDDVVARDALDNAIVSTRPSTPAGALTDSVRLNREALEQTRTAVAAARNLAPSLELTTLADTLVILEAGSLASDIEPVLPGDSSQDLDAVITLVSSVTDEELDAVNDVVRQEQENSDSGAANSAPVLSGTPATSVAENTAYLFQPTASDADGDTLTFSIANRPSWASFNTSTGRLSGTPANSDIGLYEAIVISASDGQVSSAMPAFTIAVNNVNEAPSISGTAAISVEAGALYSFRPSASDPDADALVFSINNRPSWASFNTGNGRLFGTPAAGDAGIYSNIVISVSDGSAKSSLPAFSIAVNVDVPANTAPVISGTPAGSVAEDSAYVFQPSASDAEGDSLTFSISNRPSWASFNAGTGRLSGTPGNADVGSYGNITITVSDGSASASVGPFSISVSNTNDAPSISGSPATTVDEGSSYNFRPSVSDPDGDVLTFSIQNRPAWASFNKSTGRLYGTPASGDAGTYGNIVISVSDGAKSRALPAFSIVVNSTAAQTGSALLSWNAPVTRSDGDALAMNEIGGYTIYYGSSAGNYPNSLDVNDAFTTSATISDLPVGTYYFVVTARDMGGRESGHSNMVSKSVQ